MAQSLQNRSFFNPNGGSFAHAALVAPNLPLRATHTPQGFSASVPVQDGGFLAPVLNPRSNLQWATPAAQQQGPISPASFVGGSAAPPTNSPAAMASRLPVNYGGY